MHSPCALQGLIQQAPSTTLGKVLGCSHHEGWGEGARVGMHPPAAAGGCKHVHSALGGAGDEGSRQPAGAKHLQMNKRRLQW